MSRVAIAVAVPVLLFAPRPSLAEPMNPGEFAALAPVLSGYAEIDTTDGTMRVSRALGGEPETVYQGVDVQGALVFTFGRIENLSIVGPNGEPGAYGWKVPVLLSHSDASIRDVDLDGRSYLETYREHDGPGGLRGIGGGARGGQGGAIGVFSYGVGQDGYDGGNAQTLSSGGGWFSEYHHIGGGGGAIEIGAIGTVTISGGISANGGSSGPVVYAGIDYYQGRGGGGGGAVLIHGQTIEVAGGIGASGGDGGYGGSRGGGGGGGGGSVALLAGQGGIRISGGISLFGGLGGEGGWSGEEYWNGENGELGTVLLRSAGPIEGTARIYGNVQVEVVPEPSAGLLALVGGSGLLAARRARRTG